MSTQNAEVNENQNDQQQQQQQNAGKIKKKYEENLIKLKTILGRELPKNDRVQLGESAVYDLVTEFFQEKQATEIAKVKEAIKTNLELFIKGNQDIAAKKKELEKLEETTMKNFNESIDKLLAKIEGVPDYILLAEKALNGAIGESKKGAEPPLN